MILYLLMITTKDLSWSLKLKSKMVSLKRSWRPERKMMTKILGTMTTLGLRKMLIRIGKKMMRDWCENCWRIHHN